MNKLMTIENNPIYREAYRACVAAGKNRTKAVVRHNMNIANIGTENPMNTELLVAAAKKDYKNDIQSLSKSLTTEKLGQYAKTMFELAFNPEYIKSRLKIRSAAKKLYPKTYSARKKLIEKNRVSLKSDSLTFERLRNLNVSHNNL